MSSPKEEFHWHVGRESGPYDKPPNRAYFYWLRDHCIVDAADFDASGLAKEIEQRRAASDPHIADFEAAAKRLAKDDRQQSAAWDAPSLICEPLFRNHGKHRYGLE